VDTPLLGRRLNEVRNGFRLPPHLQLLNFQPDSGVTTLPDYNTKKAKKLAEAVEKGVDPETLLSQASINGPLPYLLCHLLLPGS
jgi:(S)-2-hydroxy-acid oxidase